MHLQNTGRSNNQSVNQTESGNHEDAPTTVSSIATNNRGDRHRTTSHHRLRQYWSELNDNQKDKIVNSLRFSKSKHKARRESDITIEVSIEHLKRLSDTMLRNQVLKQWKDLNAETKKNFFHKVYNRKLKKLIEDNDMVVDGEKKNENDTRIEKGVAELVENLKKQGNAEKLKNKKEEVKLLPKLSFAEKLSSKKLNAENLISVIKKDPMLKEGEVEMPYVNILEGCKPFKTTLIGYFVDGHDNYFNVNKFAHNRWKQHGIEEVMVNEEGIYFFRFSTIQGMHDVLEGGPWMNFDQALVLKKWSTGLRAEKDKHDKIPVWVKIYNVPLEYWNGAGLSHIAWEIGKPLEVDSHTANICQQHWGRPAFMRILMEMSAEKDWFNEIKVYSRDMITGERIQVACKIEYAWKP